MNNVKYVLPQKSNLHQIKTGDIISISEDGVVKLVD